MTTYLPHTQETVPIPEEFNGHVKGIFVGGCVERGLGSSFRAMGHAHIRGDPLAGWICIRSSKRLLTAAGAPSRLLWHEYLHILTNHGHDDVWRSAMREHHQPIPRRYQKHQQYAEVVL